jgi:hypothetical protein
MENMLLLSTSENWLLKIHDSSPPVIDFYKCPIITYKGQQNWSTTLTPRVGVRGSALRKITNKVQAHCGAKHILVLYIQFNKQ